MQSNQIVSGQAVDNTLQLNQQGGGRIDIPLPDNKSDIIEIYTDFLGGSIPISNVNVEFESVYKSYSYVYLQNVRINNRDMYVAGEFYKSIINVHSSSVTDLNLSFTQSLDCVDLKGDMSFDVSGTIDIELPDGEYKVVIDVLRTNAGGSYRKKVYADDIPESEFVRFSVNDYVGTVTPAHITLPGTKFAARHRYPPSSILILSDRIMKA